MLGWDLDGLGVWYRKHPIGYIYTNCHQLTKISCSSFHLCDDRHCKIDDKTIFNINERRT